MVHDGPSAKAGVQEGDVLAGKYRVERVLGVGGMGVVVAAHHLQLDEKVALKFLLPEALSNPDAVARFAREARAAVKIKSEHVARVIDVGTLANGAPYMVMEFLDGGDLAAWIAQRGALPLEQAVEFLLQACVAVADAHALGIVHRDLKPANLFCVRRSDGQLSIKVLDFGISKMTDATGIGSVTRTSALMGSPLYMSPEQMRSSKDVDAQTDIWALGVILFEFITGRPVFLGESITELAIKVVGEPTPAVRNFRADVPAGLEAAIFKCLEKDRRQRYRNVAELALALLPFAPIRAKALVERISGIIGVGGLSTNSQVAAPATRGRETQASAGTLPPLGRTTAAPTPRKRLVGTALVIGLLLAAVAGGSFLFLRARGRDPNPEAPAVQATGPGGAPETPGTITATALSPRAEPPATTLGTEVTPSPPAAAPPDARTPSAPAPPRTAVASTGPVSPAPVRRASPNAIPKPTVPTVATPARPETAPAPKPNCNPPYVIDSAGDRQYKPECL